MSDFVRIDFTQDVRLAGEERRKQLTLEKARELGITVEETDRFLSLVTSTGRTDVPWHHVLCVVRDAGQQEEEKAETPPVRKPVRNGRVEGFTPIRLQPGDTSPDSSPKSKNLKSDPPDSDPSL